MFSELQKTLFAGTGYASETGGRMSDLRTLTVDTVRNYHKVGFVRPLHAQFYSTLYANAN